MIHVERFSKIYQDVPAVSNISFQLKPGDILGLVGPNGAGKTTTLRAMSGLIPLSDGLIRISGFDVEKDPLEVKRRLALIPDDPQLFNDLTIEQHLRFVASTYGVTEIAEKSLELLEMFELTAKRHARAGELSRGMRQKLAISCAYLHDPEVLLFDEPMTGLDPKGIRKLKSTIEDRAASGGSIVISSHLLAMVEDICSHVMILDDGHQCFFGEIAELKVLFKQDRNDATLEQIFFMATQQQQSKSSSESQWNFESTSETTTTESSSPLETATAVTE